jgi:hypothetical protein
MHSVGQIRRANLRQHRHSPLLTHATPVFKRLVAAQPQIACRGYRGVLRSHCTVPLYGTPRAAVVQWASCRALRDFTGRTGGREVREARAHFLIRRTESENGSSEESTRLLCACNGVADWGAAARTPKFSPRGSPRLPASLFSRSHVATGSRHRSFCDSGCGLAAHDCSVRWR